MQQKSEKIIYIKFQSVILNKIFSELISTLNKEISDIEFIVCNSSNSSPELPYFFISDENFIDQLVHDNIQKKIKKIYLISNKSIKIKTNIEIINYNPPFKFLNFLEYIINDVRQNFNKQKKIIALKSFSYDQSSRKIYNDKISLILTEKENEIFYFLLSSLNSVSKKILLKNIWKYNDGIDTHTLETHIYSLRKKLENKLGVKKILEHKENGYYLNKDLL